MVDSIDLKYPVMLVHGTALPDRRNLRVWGRIPDALSACGVRVCVGKQDAFGSVASNSRQLLASVDDALALFGVEKINIIAHSKGGLDARALAHLPECQGKIASITTISTPHHGVGFLSKLWTFMFPIVAVISVLMYPFLRLFFGDKKPNVYRLLRDMTIKSCAKFNEDTPDLPQIYYQSYAGKMSPTSKTRIFSLSRWAESHYDKENDGLISVSTAMWTNFKGTFSGGVKKGMTHADEVDLFKRNYVGDDAIVDQENIVYHSIPEFYVRIAADLAKLGY